MRTRTSAETALASPTAHPAITRAALRRNLRRAGKGNRSQRGREVDPPGGQPRPQPLATTLEPGLDRRDRHAQLGGGLVAGLPVEAARHEHVPVFPREGGQLLVEDRAQFRREDRRIPVRVSPLWSCGGPLVSDPGGLSAAGGPGDPAGG